LYFRYIWFYGILS